MFATRLRLNSGDFQRVCVRRSGVAVYRGDQTFLRIGPGMAAELATHRQLLGHAFPVAQIIEEGEHEGFTYVIEESLGSTTLGERFFAELEAEGAVSEDGFATYLHVVRAHARAQVAMVTTTPRWDFADLVGANQTAALLPDMSEAVHQAFGRAVTRLGELPRTLVHGDLHADNMCAGGVIDLEEVGWGPAGYDVTTAVFVPGLCNADFGTDTRAHPFYSASQIAAYLSLIDDTFEAAGLAHPSDCIDEFLLCRAISLCAKRHPRHEVAQARERVLHAMLAEFQLGGNLRKVLGCGQSG